MPIIECNGQQFHLSHEEQEKLDEFRVITNFQQEDLPLIIRLLQNYGWHLERALSFYFDGDWKGSVIATEAPAIPDRPPTPSPAAVTPVFERSPFVVSDTHLIPSLRVVKPLPSNFRDVFSVVGLNKNHGDVWNMNSQSSPLIIILMFIPKLLMRLGVGILSLLWGLVTFGFESHLDERSKVRKVPSKPAENPAPVEEILPSLIDEPNLKRLRELVSDLSFNEALKLCQDEFKYLLLIFVGDISQGEQSDVNSKRFLSKVLGNTAVLSTLERYKNELVVYMGSVHELETWLVSEDLRIKYTPECLLIGNVLNSKGSLNGVTRPSVLSKLRIGSAKKFENSFNLTIEKFHPELVVSRTEQAEVRMAREIKKMQDDAYQNSLTQDKLKEEERRMKEKEALRDQNNKAQQERERKLKETVKHLKWLRACVAVIKDDATCSNDEDIATLQFRTSGGLRLIKKFPASTKLYSLYVNIGCHLYLGNVSDKTEDWITSMDDKLHDLEKDESLLCFKDSAALKNEFDATKLFEIIDLELEKWKDDISSDLEFGFELISPFPREKIPADKQLALKEVTQLWPKGNLLVEDIVDDNEDDDEDGNSEESEEENTK